MRACARAAGAAAREGYRGTRRWVHSAQHLPHDRAGNHQQALADLAGIGTVDLLRQCQDGLPANRPGWLLSEAAVSRA